MRSFAGSRGFRLAAGGAAGTLAIAAGLLGGLGPAVSARAAAAPASTAPSSAAASSSSLLCVYRVISVWPGGFAFEITLTNVGTSPVAWSLTWTWPDGQQIASAWDVDFSQSGAAVTVTGAGNDVIIPPGGSITLSFTATGTPPPALPIHCSPAG